MSLIPSTGLPVDARISLAVIISLSGGSDRETRIVFPIFSFKSVEIPIVFRTVPAISELAYVIPICKG